MLEELHHDPIRPSRMGSGTLLVNPGPPIHPQVSENAAALQLETPAWHLNVAKSPWAFALRNKQTGLTWTARVVWMEDSGATEEAPLANVGGIERQGDLWRMQVQIAGSSSSATLDLAALSPRILRVSVRAPQFAGNNRHMKLIFDGAGPFFGSGERFDRVQLDGLKTVLRPEDLLGQPGHNWTYIPIPFLFTPRGLGVYVDTAEASTVDLSQAQQKAFSIQLQNASADAYFFIGEPKRVLEDYTSLTGRSPLSPPWAFGVWLCSYQSPGLVMEEARKLRKNGIPASAIWTFDVMGKGDIMGWPLWWTGYYPRPSEFTRQLHDMGFKALTYVHPYLRSVLDPYNLPNPSYENGLQSGLFVLNANGEPTGPAFEPFTDGNIDFTKAANVDWWEQRVRDILLKDNFDGWMEDFGEWVHDTDRFAANVNGRKMANLNPLFYHKITYEISRRAKPDVVPFVRSGYAGSQGYTRVVWGGDQSPNWTDDYGLPSVVRAGITAGLSGFAVWGPDIASNGNSKELFARWVEFGALTPIMRDHRWDKPYGAVDLWYDGQTTETFRDYARLHVSLFPYLYTYAKEAAKTGVPIMRDLLLESPDDQNTYTCADEYLLGEKILVAPVLKEGASTRSLYLPQGSWVDYWTGQISKGGRTITVPAPLEHIPILVRAGSILPQISPDTETLASDLAGTSYRTVGSDLTWRVFPSATPVQSNFTLYDNTSIEGTEEVARVDLHGSHSPILRNYEIILPATNMPRRVTLDGKTLRSGSAKAGWKMDQNNQTLHVLFTSRDFHLIVDR